MDKILTFIVNEYNEILLLKGSENDPQFKSSFWYVVTGAREEYDLDREETVKREVKEETNLLTNNNIYLNWILEYESLGVQCKEYVYISFVKKDNIVLNEESIDYKWCTYDEFIKNSGWKMSQENGVLRLEGKDYIVQDGDLMEFLFNV